MNRIYPKQAMEGYFSKWIELQEKSLNDIKESFSEVPCFYVELQDKELCGISALQEVGNDIYGESNPNDILFKEDIYKIEKEEKMLQIYLPFANKEELSLEQIEDELIIGVKNEVRRFLVPKEFIKEEIKGAKFEKGYLNIRF